MPPLPPGCSLQSPAFCETFDTAQPGGRGGDIDETRWSFSRWKFRRVAAHSTNPYDGINSWSNPDGPPTLCGQTFTGVLPPDDVRVCSGQLTELFNDYGSLPVNSFMARRAFDFTGRTGTVVFDVDAKRNDGWDGHGWWLEFWITEDPQPIPYHGAPTVGSHPRNGVGFQIAPVGDAFDTDPQVNQLNNISRFAIVENHKIIRDEALDPDPTFKVKDTMMNRFKVMVSKDKMEIWVSDYDSAEQHHIITLDELDLKFTVGYVHFQHVHYNASKVPNCFCEDSDCGGRCTNYPQTFYASNTQAYRWDNIGFDGPVYPMLRTYEVSENYRDATYEDNGMRVEALDFGYKLEGGNAATRVEVQNVDLKDALRATFNWGSEANEGDKFAFRFNGNAWHDVTIPDCDEGGWLYRALTTEVPLNELVQGTNVIEMRDASGNLLGNLDLTIHPSR